VVVKLDERKQRGLRVGLDGNAVDAPKLGTAKNVQQVKKKKKGSRQKDGQNPPIPPAHFSSTRNKNRPAAHLVENVLEIALAHVCREAADVHASHPVGKEGRENEMGLAFGCHFNEF